MKHFLLPLLLVWLLAACTGSAAKTANTAESGDSVSATTPDNAAAPASATILFAGDAMMHKGQLAAALRAGGGTTYSFDGYFTALEPYIKSADYAVINLETPLGAGDFSGYPMFCSPDGFARTIKDAGFDMLLTANNHCLDRRDAGLRRTLDVLDTLGVDHIGTYRNAAERAERLPMVIDIKGFKVGMLDYTYGTNGIPIQGDVVVDYCNKERMRADIDTLRKAGAEIVCVSIHWGTEYRLLPDSYQKDYANFLIDQNVDIINGGHPHVIQPMQLQPNADTGRPQMLIYSLGNFISDMRKTDTQGGAMARVTLRRDDNGRAYVAEAEYVPTFCIRPLGSPVNHHLMVADSVTGNQAPNARAFLGNAYPLWEKHNINVPRSTSF